MAANGGETNGKVEDRDELVQQAARDAVLNVHVSKTVPSVLTANELADVHPLALSPLRPANAVGLRDLASPSEQRTLIQSQEFSPLGRSDEELVSLCFHMFEVLDLVADEGEEPSKVPSDDDEDYLRHFTVRLSADVVRRFLQEVARRYREVPYHNFKHASNVAQFVFYTLTTCGARRYFPPIELLAVMVAALCHDLDHPGVNNAFLVNAKAPLATLYNDRAVLEQHHAAGTFRLMNLDGADILGNIPRRAYEHVRKTIVDCIMATDLAEHGQYMAALKEITGQLQDTPNWHDDAKQRGTVLLCILKAADISNEIRPPEVGEEWAKLVVTEFFAQAHLEAERGLPVAPHMDPEKNTVAKAQTGFIKFLCIPLFTELVRLIEPLATAQKQMEANLERWEGLSS
jgi:3'5'-cyclic nucleotide phosphodiesterase